MILGHHTRGWHAELVYGPICLVRVYTDVIESSTARRTIRMIFLVPGKVPGSLPPCRTSHCSVHGQRGSHPAAWRSNGPSQAAGMSPTLALCKSRSSSTGAGPLSLEDFASSERLKVSSANHLVLQSPKAACRRHACGYRLFRCDSSRWSWRSPCDRAFNGFRWLRHAWRAVLDVVTPILTIEMHGACRIQSFTVRPGSFSLL